MARYKRYKRYGRRRSTNVIKMKFQSFMDISTDDSSMQIITVSAGGKEILKRLSPQFGAYKYYKIGNIAVKLVPASTLPVDPTGLSYEAGENTVDPRDQLTPGMMRITNGEDIFENISGLSDDQQHAIYNNMLLDPRWFKWMLQSGVKRHATPRYWQVGQLHQDKWPGATLNVPDYDMDSSTHQSIQGTAFLQFHTHEVPSEGGHGSSSTFFFGKGSAPEGFFQTGHRGVLGWLPTDGYEYGQPFIASPPEVEVMKIILPKAYKTKYFYRMFVTETVYFKEPIVNFGIPYGDNNYQYRPLDVFHDVSYSSPQKPGTPLSGNYPTDTQTGGNYGDN